MKNVQVSDELYDELKNWVVDPFDDTPEIVIKRAIDIAGKAKERWSPLDTFGGQAQQEDHQDHEEHHEDNQDEDTTEYKQQPRRNPEPYPDDKGIKVS